MQFLLVGHVKEQIMQQWPTYWRRSKKNIKDAVSSVSLLVLRHAVSNAFFCCVACPHAKLNVLSALLKCVEQEPTLYQTQ